MSFTDQKPFEITEKHLTTKWGAEGGTPYCYLCGHRFCLGEICRWVYGGSDTGNFFTCAACDGDDVKQRMKTHLANLFELKKKFPFVFYTEGW